MANRYIHAEKTNISKMSPYAPWCKITLFQTATAEDSDSIIKQRFMPRWLHLLHWGMLFFFPSIHHVVCYKPLLVSISWRNAWFNQHLVFYTDTIFDLVFISNFKNTYYITENCEAVPKDIQMPLLLWEYDGWDTIIICFSKFIWIRRKGFESSEISYVAL